MAKFDDLFNSVKSVFFKDAKGRFRKRSIDDFENVKNQIIGRIAQHPVTNELETNKESNFIEATNGRSFSLFGALGFESNRQPREEIVQALKDEITIESSPSGTSYFLRLPDKKDLDNNDLLKLDKRTESWVSYIEEGIDNLTFYFEKDGYGRSNLGFQNKSENNLSRSYNGTDYLFKIFDEFKEKYRGSLKII